MGGFELIIVCLDESSQYNLINHHNTRRIMVVVIISSVYLGTSSFLPLLHTNTRVYDDVDVLSSGNYNIIINIIIKK